MSDTGDNNRSDTLYSQLFDYVCIVTYKFSSWRTSRGSVQNQNRQPGQHRQLPPRDRSSGSHTPVRQSGEAQGLSAMSGNVWPNEKMNRAGSLHGPAQEQHIPVRSFNAKDTREELLRGRRRPTQFFARFVSTISTAVLKTGAMDERWCGLSIRQSRCPGSATPNSSS